MQVKVVKFGGSSLADANQFKKVKDIIMADKQRAFVIPSAPGKRTYKDEKVTDMLYKCQSEVTQGNLAEFENIFSRIIERFVNIAYELNLKCDILGELNNIAHNLKNGASADYAASRGEYLNGMLLAEYLDYEFIDATELIRFDADKKFDARCTQKLMQDNLKDVRNAVIPGFYGAQEDGEVVTFSRGGSDITGAIVSRGVDAEIYENWTDVSGLLMADPRIVNNPRAIKTVTYTELRELAYMGASVLHDESIFPVRQACIPINVKNTNSPEDIGTMIVPDDDEIQEELTITGIAGRVGFSVIAIRKDKMHAEVGFVANVLNVLAQNGISVEHMPTGIDTISLIVEDSQLKDKTDKVLKELMENCGCDALELENNMAMIAVVGRGMIKKIGTSATLFNALAKVGVNIRMIDQGSSEINIIIGIEAADFAQAMNAIYFEFTKK